MFLNTWKNLKKKFRIKLFLQKKSRSLTYSELVDYARRIGTCIVEDTNNARRKPIVVFVERNIESLVSFMAIAYSGNFYVPIDMQMPKLRIELILETLQPIAALVLRSDLEYAKSISAKFVNYCL